MIITLNELSEIIGGKVSGNGSVLITGAAGVSDAQKGDITFLSNPKYINQAKNTNASAIIVNEQNKDVFNIPKIVSENPYLSFGKVLEILYSEEKFHPTGIHSLSCVEKSAVIGKDVAVGPFSVIEANVKIGDNTIIYSGCFVGKNTKIGKNCLIYPNVTVREKSSVGNDVIIHSGTVIGSDGFGYAQSKGTHHKVPQIGIVEISDDVEIGANVTIDRATTGKTFIGRGTKIDNLVQIAHNVVIGENCIIVSQVGISGSTKIGNNVILAGQVGLVGHINIGNNVTIAAKSGVHKDIPDGKIYFGYPAREHNESLKINAIISKLPQIYEELKKLKKGAK